MASNKYELNTECISFLSRSDDDNMRIGDLNSSLSKLTDAVKVFIELRNDIFMQREEKIQQYKHDQVVHLKCEEEEYVKKRQALEKNIAECRLKLKETECSYSDLKKKIIAQTDINKKLNDDITKFQKEREQKQEQFLKTFNLYSTVLQWYQDSLNINIILNKENSRIITFYFDKSAIGPYIQFEVLQNFLFKVLDVHSEIQDDKENFQKIYNQYGVMNLIYNAHEGLKRGRSSLKRLS